MTERKNHHQQKSVFKKFLRAGMISKKQLCAVRSMSECFLPHTGPHMSLTSVSVPHLWETTQCPGAQHQPPQGCHLLPRNRWSTITLLQADSLETSLLLLSKQHSRKNKKWKENSLSTMANIPRTSQEALVSRSSSEELRSSMPVSLGGELVAHGFLKAFTPHSLAPALTPAGISFLWEASVCSI